MSYYTVHVDVYTDVTEKIWNDDNEQLTQTLTLILATKPSPKI